MKVTILDTVTGERREIDPGYDDESRRIDTRDLAFRAVSG
jgi:hypothetical protein